MNTAVSPSLQVRLQSDALLRIFDSMKTSLRSKLDGLAMRLAELDHLLAAEDATRDLDRYRTLTKEHAEIEPVVARLSRLRESGSGSRRRDGVRARSGDEGTCRRGALPTRRRASTRIAGELQAMLLPKDPNDERNVFLELRAGTGGDESALFAGSLFRMYTRYAERQALEGRDRVRIAVGARRLQGSDRARRRRRCVFEAQVRVRRPSRAARARNRSAGAHPYVRVHGGGAARGRSGCRHHDQSCATFASTRSARRAPAGST